MLYKSNCYESVSERSGLYYRKLLYWCAIIISAYSPCASNSSDRECKFNCVLNSYFSTLVLTAFK